MHHKPNEPILSTSCSGLSISLRSSVPCFAVAICARVIRILQAKLAQNKIAQAKLAQLELVIRTKVDLATRY